LDFPFDLSVVNEAPGSAQFILDSHWKQMEKSLGTSGLVDGKSKPSDLWLAIPVSMLRLKIEKLAVDLAKPKTWKISLGCL
jgi:hypothetical protein